jgi:hypothetical protein
MDRYGRCLPADTRSTSVGMPHRNHLLMHSAMAKSLKRTLPSLLTAITVICAIGLMVSGIFLHRISGTYSFLVGQEYHYSTTLGPALRLVVDPSVSLETMRVNYGLLFSITSAEVARLFSCFYVRGMAYRNSSVSDSFCRLCALRSLVFGAEPALTSNPFGRFNSSLFLG